MIKLNMIKREVASMNFFKVGKVFSVKNIDFTATPLSVFRKSRSKKVINFSFEGIGLITKLQKYTNNQSVSIISVLFCLFKDSEIKTGYFEFFPHLFSKDRMSFYFEEITDPDLGGLNNKIVIESP
jgi:hypothetical protein